MSRVTEQYQKACQYLAGGVSSSTRLNRAVGHAMLFDRADGCRVWDLDGKEYIDLCCSHGATLLGHGDGRVRQAVEAALARGAACSYENEQHTELAQLLCETIPCLERVRFTGSGTEATLHCLRLARAFTGRAKMLKFEGNFHGYHDQVMFAIGTPADRLGPGDKCRPCIRRRPACRPDWTSILVVVPYNRHRSARRGLSPARARTGRRAVRADLLQCRLRRADCGVHGQSAPADARTWHPAHLRRGAERVSHGPGGSPGIPGRSRRICARSARRSAAAIHSVCSAAGATSWIA